MKLKILIPFLLILSICMGSSHAQNKWIEKESEHFTLIYRETHSGLTDHILNSAEKSYKLLAEIFKSSPNGKIIINTYDVFDYGMASTTSVPDNFIRLEIEPFEPGYEMVVYNERIQWVLSHELVHVFFNDQSNGIESLIRTLFGKVSPEKTQPLTIPFSLAGNKNRYSPRWFHESFAVYLETWMSGGYGRTLGSFDEMFFRTMVEEENEFPNVTDIETILANNSFLLQTNAYLYGARFLSFLSIEYGSKKVINWFKTENDSFLSSIYSRFEEVFNNSFENEWKKFIRFETIFQEKNIKRINKSKLKEGTPVLRLPVGWISKPEFDPISKKIYLSTHQSHNLAQISELDIENKKINKIHTQQTPSIQQVSSTTYNPKLQQFFYTTNNNQLYRDLWVLDVNSKESSLLFKDLRIGTLTTCSRTDDLLGVIHDGGSATIVLLEYPYNKIKPLFNFNFGVEVYNIALSPKGDNLAIVLHKSSGDQELLVADYNLLKNSGNFKYDKIAVNGSPENPSWSFGGNEILWNSFVNGVSNIYKYNFNSQKTKVISNSLSGLFKPLQYSDSKIIAFKFTTSGFLPVIIQNTPIEYLPAIKYLGQEVVNSDPEVIKLKLDDENLENYKSSGEYSGIKNLKVLTFIPTITGFQKELVYGGYFRISDPLVTHDITAEIGYSPKRSKFHINAKYEYKKKFLIGYEYNASNFYDLFNNRKRGMVGTKYTSKFTNYWEYDNPLKIKQEFQLDYYSGIGFINDNKVKVSEPNFLVFNTRLNVRNMRRSIGSSDYEEGEEFNLSFQSFGSNSKNLNISAQIFADWEFRKQFLTNHNSIIFKTSVGYHHDNKNLIQSRFYFGGFGNRYLETENAFQFRNTFRFPGMPIFNLQSTSFVKSLIENSFPPIRFRNFGTLSHLMDHMDFSIYSNQLIIEKKLNLDNKFINLGAQVNFVFKHWLNLESTLSFGAANMWSKSNNSFEWFVSFKLLKS